MISKRLLDILVSFFAIIILSPIFLFITIVIKFSSRNQIFFRQQRPGLHNKPFIIYKFCTLVDIYDDQGYLLSETERLVPFGRFLRRTSIDELPELFNVLRGEMSLVGPRPLLMRYLNRYTPKQIRRHEVKPGITGWAQIHGRNNTTWEERFEQDLWYVEHYSFSLDCKIIMATIPVLFRSGGGNEEAWQLGEYMGPGIQPNRSGKLA